MLSRNESHFGPLPSLPWPLRHVRLISFLGLIRAALLCFSSLPVNLLIPALRGLSQNERIGGYHQKVESSTNINQKVLQTGALKYPIVESYRSIASSRKTANAFGVLGLD